jgi:hypothetical protein
MTAKLQVQTRQIAANALPPFVTFCRLFFGPVFSSTIWLGDGVIVEIHISRRSLRVTKPGISTLRPVQKTS